MRDDDAWIERDNRAIDREVMRYKRERFEPVQITPDTVKDKVLADLAEAEAKAWDSLARYKFQMFGYWAAIWVHLNRLSGEARPNPWRGLVQTAKKTNAEAAKT